MVIGRIDGVPTPRHFVTTQPVRILHLHAQDDVQVVRHHCIVMRFPLQRCGSGVAAVLRPIRADGRIRFRRERRDGRSARCNGSRSGDSGLCCVCALGAYVPISPTILLSKNMVNAFSSIITRKYGCPCNLLDSRTPPTVVERRSRDRAQHGAGVDAPSALRGTVNQNVEPCPTFDSTPTLPPWLSTML